MNLQPNFRSGVGKDAGRYIAHKRSLGRSFDDAIRVLADLDGFLSRMGISPLQDLTAETFTRWSESLGGHLSPNTKLARMRVVLKFCIYRRRSTPECFVPDPTQFPKRCPLFRPFIFSECDVARILGNGNIPLDLHCVGRTRAWRSLCFMPRVCAAVNYSA